MAELGIEITADDRTGPAVRRAERRLRGIDDQTGSIGTRFGGAAVAAGVFATAAGAAATVLGVQFARSVVSSAVEVDRWRDRTGLSVETLQEMAFAGRQAGVDLEDMVDVLEEARIKANDAATGSEDMARVFDELGISVGDFLELSADEQWDLLIEAIENVNDETRRTILVDELASDAGKRLLTVLQANEGGYEALREQAHEFGLVLEDEVIDQLVDVDENFRTARQSVEGMALALGVELLPHLVALSSWMNTDGIPQLVAYVGRLQEVARAIGDVVSGIRSAADVIDLDARDVATAATNFIPGIAPFSAFPQAVDDARGIGDRLGGLIDNVAGFTYGIGSDVANRLGLGGGGDTPGVVIEPITINVEGNVVTDRELERFIQVANEKYDRRYRGRLD